MCQVQVEIFDTKSAYLTHLVKWLEQINLFCHLSFICVPFYVTIKHAKSENKYKNVVYDEEF